MIKRIYILHTLVSVLVDLHLCASCNMELISLLRPSARLLRRHIYAKAAIYTVHTRARAGREICADAVYNVSASMYYIRAKEWCNKEAVSRSLPSIPEAARLRASRMRACVPWKRTPRCLSAAASARRHMQFYWVAQKITFRKMMEHI